MVKSDKRSTHTPLIRPELQAFLAAVCSILFGSWAADEIRDLFHYFIRETTSTALLVGYMVGAVVSFVLFLLSLYWLYRLRKLWVRPRTRLRQDENPPTFSHLVLFLSHLNTKQGQFENGIPKSLQLSGDLVEDLKQLCALKEKIDSSSSIRWAWEMPLRAIAYHAVALQTVTLICSKESLQQVHWFTRLLQEKYQKVSDKFHVQLLLRKEAKASVSEARKEPIDPHQCDEWGWDFEDFDDLSNGMIDLLHHFHEKGIRENQIVVDFTGGKKVTSVIGASVTFNREVSSQYVQTDTPHRVIGYDLVLRPEGEEYL